MIAATLCVRGDADIVQDTVRNMLEQGVDKVYAYTSGAEAFGAIADLNSPHVWAVRDTDDQFHQTKRMDRLAEIAGANGAEWVIPFDADEFWGTLGGNNIATTLHRLPRSVGKAYATLWHHQTWDDKVVPAERLPKVAYRWHPDAHIHPGGHDVDMPAGLDSVNVFAIRHFQYRSEVQFRARVADAIQRTPPESKAQGDGTHLTQYDGATDEQMAAAWRALCARPTVRDPIPYQR